MRRWSKYNAHPVITEEGKFASEFEYTRWQILKKQAERGEITALRKQVEYELIPRQTEVVEVKLKTKTKMVEKFCEHPCKYVADFVYINSDGVEIVEDTKGFKTEEYRIKRKLMRLQGHPITEVYEEPKARKRKKVKKSQK